MVQKVISMIVSFLFTLQSCGISSHGDGVGVGESIGCGDKGDRLLGLAGKERGARSGRYM